MASQADVRRIALSLPGTEEAPGHFAFSVRNHGKPKGLRGSSPSGARTSWTRTS